MIRTQILLTQDLYQKIKQISQSKKISMSAVIREQLAENFTKRRKTGKDFFEATKHLQFSDPSLPTDLSTNDDYLYTYKGTHSSIIADTNKRKK